MSILDDFLEPSERVIWRGKPDKKAYILWGLSGLPFALFFFILFFGVAFPRLNFLGLPLLILVGLFVIPPVIQLIKLPNEDYMLTDERLLIKSGKKEKDIWFTKLENMKYIHVERGIFGKISGTGTIYPITDTHPPFNPKNPDWQGLNRFAKLACMKDPYKIQRIFEEEIFFDYVECEYCSYMFDLNEEKKCPKCGRTHQKKIDPK